MKAGKSRLVNQDSFKADFDYTTAQGPSSNQTASLKSVAEAEPSALFAFKECQDLLRTRLTGPMLRIIPQLTGVRLQVLWHRPLDDQKPNESPIPCPQARQLASANRGQPARCRACLQRRWKPALAPASQSRRFIGQCGPPTSVPAFRRNRSARSRWSCRRASRLVLPHAHSVSHGRAPWYRAKHAGKSVSPAAFDHAVVLVRLLLHDLESAAQARTGRGRSRKPPLAKAKPTQPRPRGLSGELRRPIARLPPKSTFPPVQLSRNHARTLVETIHDYVQATFHRPLSLKDWPWP